jgi:hypothetical protein
MMIAESMIAGYGIKTIIRLKRVFVLKNILICGTSESLKEMKL